MAHMILESKLTGETLLEPFDFAARLAVGETLSAASTTPTVHSGTDTTPGGVVVSSTISGTKVSVKVTGGVLGVTYLLTCQASTSLGQILQLTAFLVIVPK